MERTYVAFTSFALALVLALTSAVVGVRLYQAGEAHEMRELPAPMYPHGNVRVRGICQDEDGVRHWEVMPVLAPAAPAQVVVVDSFVRLL
jgi:hypothetical protein